jgi:hypothetical protein
MISNAGSQDMGRLDGEPDLKTDIVAAPVEDSGARSPRYVPCNDAVGRGRRITAEDQALKAQAIAKLVAEMLAMPDEDPPGAWEEAMRDLDAQRPHRKLFEGRY